MTTTSGIFILTDPQQLNNLATIKDKLLSQYNAMIDGQWSLVYRHLQSTSTDDFQFLLQLSHHSKRTFMAARAGNESPVIEIPNEQMETFYKLLTDKFNTLWSIRLRLMISNGAAYKIGDVTVRLGELRPLESQNVRALICNVETTSSVSVLQDSDDKIARIALSDIAESIGFLGSKETFESYKAGSSSDEVQLFCKALRYRA